MAPPRQSQCSEGALRVSHSCQLSSSSDGTYLDPQNCLREGWKYLEFGQNQTGGAAWGGEGHCEVAVGNATCDAGTVGAAKRGGRNCEW